MRGRGVHASRGQAGGGRLRPRGEAPGPENDHAAARTGEGTEALRRVRRAGRGHLSPAFAAGRTPESARVRQSRIANGESRIDSRFPIPDSNHKSEIKNHESQIAAHVLASIPSTLG